MRSPGAAGSLVLARILGQEWCRSTYPWRVTSDVAGDDHGAKHAIGTRGSRRILTRTWQHIAARHARSSSVSWEGPMGRLRRVALLALAGLALLPSVSSAQAQASIAGVARDTSGAVLPGVTVEASSPALIEKVRLGRLRRHRSVPDHRPASRQYTVTFTLPGFSHRETRERRADGLEHGHRRTPNWPSDRSRRP
jgi:hypothetical protein